jgi:uncharacterized SAM-binding protein YcdF (DUF218 family)
MPRVIRQAKKTFRDDCDYLMILGGDIIGAETPSPQLFERMKAAAAYLKENKDCFIVPCGGCFREGQKKSEAEIIASYLVEEGIDKNRIILEDKSTTTFENFLFASEIIKNHSKKNLNDANIAFLSSTYHIYRSTVIAKACGIENIGKVSCVTPGDAYKRFIREYFVGYDLLYRLITKKYSDNIGK